MSTQPRLLSSTEPELRVFQELPADRVRARAMRISLNQAGDGLVGTYLLDGQGGNFLTSPDGAVIALQSSRHDRANQRLTRGIELRNGLTGELIAMVAEGSESRGPIALSSTRRTLIVMERRTGHLIAWDLTANQLLWQVQIFADDFPRDVTAAYSPDESKVAVATRGSHAVYETATGNVVAALEIAADAQVAELAFLDEEQLAGCIRGESLRIWDVATGAAAIEHGIPALRLSDDGRMALVADEKPEFSFTTLHSLAVHDTLTGNLIREFALDESITSRSMDFDPEGEHVFVAVYRQHGPILAFNIESGEVAAQVQQGMSSSLFMRPITGLRALSSSFDHLIHVWDLNRTQERRVAEQPGIIRLVDMTADGRFGVTDARAEGELHLWDLETGKPIAVFKVSTEPRFLSAICISDDAAFALVNDRASIWRIDLANGNVNVLLESPPDKEFNGDVRVSGDGAVAVATRDDETLVFDPANGALLMTTKEGRNTDVSSDGGIVLVDNLLINRHTGDETSFDGFNLSNLQMSDDGSRAIDFWPSEGYTVWNLVTQTPLAGAALEWKYESSSQSRSDCDLSADGRIVVCGDLDGQLAVYDTQEPKRLATIAIDDSAIPNIVLSADGSSIFLATHMGRLHHYRLENLPGSTDAE